MKHFYLAFLFFTLAATHAQTLTQSFNEPVVGDIDKNYRLDTSAYTSGLPVNTTGSACVWNYTHLFGTFPMIVDSFIAPSAAIGATAFPNATFVQHRDNLYTYYQSNTGTQQTSLLGGYSPTLTITFTNSGIIAGYPVSYGYNLSDVVGGTFKYNTTNGDCNGNITISAIGQGTINMPNGVSVPNALCLKSVEILTLSAGILPFGTFNQTVYNYYIPARKFPVLSVNYSTYQFLAGTPTITAFVYGSTNHFALSAIGINATMADNAEYRAFPNPFHHELSVPEKSVAEENGYLFYDLNGRLALKTMMLTAQETEQLAPGMYTLEIRNRSGSRHQKVVKE